MKKDLSLEEKIGQMFMFGVNKNNIDGILELIKNNKIGGVILYKQNYTSYEEMLSLIKRIREANASNKTPLLIAIDQEGGRVNRMPPEFKNLRSITYVSDLNKPSLIKKYSEIISKELSECNINMNFAPVLDINNNSNNNVIKLRCFSNEEQKVSEYGKIYIKEMQSNNVIPVVKHFPGHGCTKKDSHMFLPYINNYKEMLNKHMKPFEAAIKNNCDAIMVGHIIIPKLTGVFPASISQKFISEYLRKRYNYDGLVITDDIRMKSVSILYRGVALKKAFTSESDIVLFKYRKGDEKIIEKVVDMAKKGIIPEEKINESVSRILKIKEKYKVTDKILNKGCNIEEINKEIEKLNSNIK